MRSAIQALLAPLAALLLTAGQASAVIITTGTSSGTFAGNSTNPSLAYNMQSSANVLVFGAYQDANYTASSFTYNGVPADGFIQNQRAVLAYFYNPAPSGSISFASTASSANSAYFLYELSNVNTSALADLGTAGTITTTTDNRFIVDFIGLNNADGSLLAANTAGGSILTRSGVGNANGAAGGGSVGGGFATEATTGLAGAKTLGWTGNGGGFFQGEVAAAFVAAAGGPVPWNVNGGGSWNTGANWAGGAAPAPGGEAFLGSVLTAANAPATITINSPVTVGTLTISNPNRYDIAGPSTLTLNGAADILVGEGTHGVSAVIAGSAGLSKTGGGTLILSANNTYTGATDITGGTLQLRNTGAVDGAVDVSASANLAFGAGYNGAFNGAISGAGGVVLDRSLTTETVTLGGANSYSGPVVVNGGTLSVNQASALGAGDSTPATQTRISGDEVAGVEDAGKLALSGNVSVNNELLILGPRANATLNAVHVTSSGSNAWNGNIKGEALGNQYNFESTAGVLTLSGKLAAPDNDGGARDYVFSGAGSFNVTGKITDVGTDANGEDSVGTVNAQSNVRVVKRGAGTLTISTASSQQNDFWQLGTVVEAGTLEVISDGGGNGELWGPINVRSGATLDVDHFSTYSLQPLQTLTGAGTIRATGASLAIFDDNSITPGDTGVGTLTINGNASLTAVGGGGALAFELGNNPATIGGTESDLISISGALTTNGTPTMPVNLRAAEGAVTAGQYRLISHTGGTVNVSGLTPQFRDAAGNPLTVRQGLAISAAPGQVNLDVTGSAANLVWTGANGTAWDKNTTQNWSDGAPNVFFDQDQVLFDDTAGANDTVNIAAGNVYPSVANFHSATANTYTLTGPNGFLGDTPINLTGDVTVVLANTNTLAGVVNVGAGTTLNIGQGGGSSTVTGNITGAGNLVIGGGFNPFQSANSLTGPIAINAGVVTVSNAGAFGTTDSGTSINGSGNINFNFQSLSVAEPMTLNGGSLTVAGNDGSGISLTGPLSVAAGGGTFQVGTNLGADALAINNNISGSAGGDLNVVVSAGSTVSFNGNYAHNGRLVKSSGGVLALGPTTTVAASEVVANGGTINVTAQPALTLGAGQTLAGTDGGSVVGNVVMASGSTVRVGEAVMPQKTFAEYTDATFGLAATPNPTANTTLIGGGDLAAPDGIFSGNDAWSRRTGAWNGGNLLQGAPIAPYPDTESVPVIQTVVSGLNPGQTYTVYANFWDVAGGASWPINAGFSPTGLSLYANPADNVAGATAAVNVSTLSYATPIIGTESDKTLFAAPLGTMMADASGNITVYVDDTGNGPNNRTWYDGITITGGIMSAIGETLTITGNLTLNAGSTLAMNIGTPAESDLLAVSGALVAGGTLSVSLDNTVATPTLGTVFDILNFASASGTFSSVVLPSLGGGLGWDTSALLTTGQLTVIAAVGLDGDYNGDGVVNAADYVVWRDGDSPDSTEAGYTLWRNNFGATGAGSSIETPEPGAAGLAVLAVLGLCVRRRRG